MTTPPIPERLAHLPVQGGLVVPVIAVARGDGQFDHGVNNATAAREMIRRGLCGICAEPLTGVVVAVTAKPETGYATDPPMHPECAAYSMRACPMLAGRLPRYRDRSQSDAVDPTLPVHRGEPAPPTWYAVWLTRYSQAIGGEPPRLIGAAWDADDVLKIREVKRPA